MSNSKHEKKISNENKLKLAVVRQYNEALLQSSHHAAKESQK